MSVPHPRGRPRIEPEQLTRWTGALIVVLALGAVFSGLQYRAAVLRDRARSLEVAESRARDLLVEFKTRVETWVWLGLLEAFVPAFRASAENMEETADDMRRRGDTWLANCSRESSSAQSRSGQPVSGDCLGIRPETYLVFEVEGARVAVSDTLREGAVPASVLDSLRRRAEAAPDDMRRFHVIQVTVDTSTFLAHMRVMRDAWGRRLATAALVRTSGLSRQLFTPLWERTLASTFPQAKDPQQLASLSVALDDGRVLHASPTQYDQLPTSSRIWGATDAPVSARVHLNPARLDGVVPGGIAEPPDLALATGAAVLLVVVVSALFALHQARQLMHSRTLFLTGVSHELRTPLTQILMYAETLEHRDLDPVKRSKAQHVIVRESRRLIHMIENILAFARGETGRLPLNPRPLSLSQAIDDTVADMAPMLARHGARIDCRLDPAIDVFADAGAVRQVLVNLIDNALRYGPPHQTITMLTEREGNHALLSVVDDGPGIAPAAQSLAWLPFTRLHPDGAGTGLGLPLVRRLAEAMGGSATFGAPLQGKAGLRVDVRLPLARAPLSQPAHPPVPVAS